MQLKTLVINKKLNLTSYTNKKVVIYTNIKYWTLQRYQYISLLFSPFKKNNSNASFKKFNWKIQNKVYQDIWGYIMHWGAPRFDSCYTLYYIIL